MSSGAYEVEEIRRELRRALIAAGLGDRVVEALERIVLECIRGNMNALQTLRRVVATAGVINIGQVLARFGCVSMTTDDPREAVELVERLARRY